MQINLVGGTPSLEFSDIAYTKILLYIQLYSEEISWLGHVTREKDNVFFVKDVFLVKQKCSSGTTEMDPGGIQDLGWALMQAGTIDLMKQETEGIYLWGHSHHTMGTGPSGQDNKQMDDFQGTKPPFFIRMISNKRGEHNIELYLFQQGIKVTAMTFTIRFNVANHPLAGQITEEIKDKVSKFVYITPPRTAYAPGAYPLAEGFHGGYGRYSRDLGFDGDDDLSGFGAYHCVNDPAPDIKRGRGRNKYLDNHTTILDTPFTTTGTETGPIGLTLETLLARKVFDDARPDPIHDIHTRS